ncbi:MAG: YncE family protein, partial [Terriglobales bacterium]
YVANHQANTVDVINLQTRHLTAAIPVGLGPAQLQLGGLGAYLFVADQTSDDIAVIRTDIPALVTLFPSLPQARAMQAANFRSPAAPLPR